MVPDTHLQKNHGTLGGEKWSQKLSKCQYLSTDLSTRLIDHGRYPQSIRIHLLENTVDIDSRCRFTYGELRLMVDRRLKIEIILWLISLTTHVQGSGPGSSWIEQFDFASPNFLAPLKFST